MSVVHLHNHTSYSLLDGASKVDELAKAAAADGQPALAITDHGVLYGLVDFYKACEKEGVKPILGIESYFCDDQAERGKKSEGASDIDGSDKRYYHLTVLARNNAGYRNLMKLSTDAYLEGFYYKPRTSWEKLEQFSDGLIATSGCLGGPILQELLHNRFDQALKKAARLQDIFGKDNFFIELQDHGLVEQKRTNPQLIDISRRIGAPVVACNDSHYVHHHDAEAHDTLLCLQTGARIADEKRFKFQSDQHYLKSGEEMRHLFREVPDAVDNTLRIAERVETKLEFGKLHLPVFGVPEQYENPTQFLTSLAMDGLVKKYGEPQQVHYERLAYELGTIDALGLSSYFLIVWDLVNHADSRGIRRGPARGSVAGSLVAFCLDISRVDPIRHNLLFERFLNPSRIAMPDIDLDFDTRYRDELINYTFDTYGNDRVAQIITFQQIRARAAVRDSARILGYEPKVGDKIAKAMPGLVMGESTPLAACFELNPRYEIGYQNAESLRQMYAADPDVKRVVDVARGLEGLIRQDSIHAAAVVITPDNITDYVPAQRKPDKDSPTGYGPVTTQYEKNAIEDLGLLKMDYLGLRNLDVIDECIKLIGYDPGVDKTTFDDKETFGLLCRGDTVGVFQLESKPMRDLLVRMQPNSIDDIAAVVALYRPGPMASNMHIDYADRKNGRQQVTFFHEDAKEHLGDTYGLMIYQEQVMKIAQKFAGYSLVDADGLRKIIGKKLIDKMIVEREKFVSGCESNGYTAELANRLFEMIEAFAAYAFNASHAYGYAYLSYQTAFLKANFPVQYMTALCSSVASKIEKSAVFLGEARRMGINVHTPDVNKSGLLFTSDDGIRVGLAAIKNIGEDLGEKIIAERNRSEFVSLIDFIERVKPNAGQVESLALAGAFDQWGSRLGISSVASDILSLSRKANKKVIKDQGSLFDRNEVWSFEIPTSEYPPRARLEAERQALGIYVSGHPLDPYTQLQWRLSDIGDLAIGDDVDVMVLIEHVVPKTTKMGASMGILTLSDQTGVRESVCFPRTWSQVLPKAGEIGTAELKIGTDYNGERNLVFNGFNRIVTEDEDVNMAKMRIYLPQGFSHDDAAISKLKGVLVSHYGNDRVLLQVGKSALLELPEAIKVNVDDGLIDDLRKLFKEFSER